MTDISRFLFLRHLRSEPSQQVLCYRRGKLVRSGRGLAFWFLPLHAAIASIPVENLDVPFLFHSRSRDFQEVHAQGLITYRITDAARAAEKVDFSLDLVTGTHRHKPLERIAGMLTELAQQLAHAYLSRSELQRSLAEGCDEIRARIESGLRSDPGLGELGLTIVAVRVSSVTPSSEVEKALRVPMREAIQQEADEATFRRRALAVEKERAIQENELQNKIELAKREEQLIGQKGANQRRVATDEAESARIAAAGAAERAELQARAQAEGIRVVEGAKVGSERERMLIYREFPSERLLALAAQEFAGKLKSIEHVSVTPDHLGAILGKLGWSAGPGAVPSALPAGSPTKGAAS